MLIFKLSHHRIYRIYVQIYRGDEMKTLFARVASLIFVFIVFFSLTACLYSSELVPCDEILDAMISGEIGLPAGKAYSSKAKEGEKGYISASLMRALYGGEGSQELISGWIEYSFFLPDNDSLSV